MNAIRGLRWTPGDHLDLGDLSTLPRLDVRTGVGSVRAELKGH
jgi:hypothetical protein